MSDRTCWTCGTRYSGHSCPVCAVKAVQQSLDSHAASLAEDAAATRRAVQESMDEATLRMEQATEAAALSLIHI